MAAPGESSAGRSFCSVIPQRGAVWLGAPLDAGAVLVLVLQGAMPTAMGMSVVCSTWGIAPGPMIRLMSLMYLLCLVTIPVFVVAAVTDAE